MFLTALINVAVLLGMAIPGYVCRKIKKIKNIDGVVYILYFAQGFMIISVLQKLTYTPDLLPNILWAFGISTVGHVALIFLFYFLFNKFGGESNRIYTFASVMANCGFMGLPVLEGLVESGNISADVTLYVAINMIVFNFLSWTLCVFLATNDKKYISLKQAVLNPPTAGAIFVALPLFFLGITFPAWLNKGITYLGNLCVPLSMIVMGVRLADMKVKDILCDKFAYISTLAKLVVSPLILFVIMYFIPTAQSVKTALYVAMAMPTASSVLMIAELHGSTETAGKASRAQLLSTLLSLLTIPLMVLIIQ